MRTSVLAAGAAAVVAMAGCGRASGPVPDVVGERLDVATSLMDDAGYGTEPIGGGAFGILDESNWTVCETMPAAGATTGDDVRLVVARTCDGASAAAPEAAADEPEPEVDAEPEPEPADDPVQTPERVTVPDVVGEDHQAAQDELQAAGLYSLREEDATGQGRALLFDRNWVVVAQSPSAGSRVDADRTITLTSKKDGE